MITVIGCMFSKICICRLVPFFCIRVNTHIAVDVVVLLALGGTITAAVLFKKKKSIKIKVIGECF